MNHTFLLRSPQNFLFQFNVSNWTPEMSYKHKITRMLVFPRVVPPNLYYTQTMCYLSPVKWDSS